METHEQGRRSGQWLTFTIEKTAAALGSDRSTCYELVAADLLPVPVLRLGRRMVVGRRALVRNRAERSPRRGRTAAAGEKRPMWARGGTMTPRGLLTTIGATA